MSELRLGVKVSEQEQEPVQHQGERVVEFKIPSFAEVVRIIKILHTKCLHHNVGGSFVILRRKLAFDSTALSVRFRSNGTASAFRILSSDFLVLTTFGGGAKEYISVPPSCQLSSSRRVETDLAPSPRQGEDQCWLLIRRTTLK